MTLSCSKVSCEKEATANARRLIRITTGLESRLATATIPKPLHQKAAGQLYVRQYGVDVVTCKPFLPLMHATQLV